MPRILLMAAVLAMLLSACGPRATPTIDAAQVQATAMAAAATMVAATQAARPTSTPIPPSPTALPSPTPGLLPTISVLPSATSASSASECNHPLDTGAGGASAPVLIRNDTRGPVTFSMGLASKNSFGECGYLAWANIPKMNSITVSVPQTRTNQGDPCYWAYAFINDPRHQTTVSGGGFCINNPDKWTFDVSYDKIKLTPP